jgi:hypothetical protein
MPTIFVLAPGKDPWSDDHVQLYQLLKNIHDRAFEPHGDKQ